MPGVTATLEDRDDGTYIVKGLRADQNYMQMQEDKQKPGLWRVGSKVGGEPEFQSDGNILREKFRPVVISDISSDDPGDIAAVARDDLSSVDTTVQRMVNSSGFDLHHTPGEGSIIGLKPAVQAIATNVSQAITESATLLANTMYRARNIDGVLWFSDWGGSAVLTRALQILDHGQNTKLDKHAIFLNRPTSNSSEALGLAKKLRLTLAGNGGKNEGLHMREIRGNRLHANLSFGGAFKSGVFGLSATSAALGVVGAAPTAVGAVGVAGALYFVCTTVESGLKKLSGKKYK